MLIVIIEMISDLSAEKVGIWSAIVAAAGLIGNLIKKPWIGQLVEWRNNRSKAKFEALKAKNDSLGRAIESRKVRILELEKELEVEKARIARISRDFELTKMRVVTVMETMNRFTPDEKMQELVTHLIDILDINTTPAS